MRSSAISLSGSLTLSLVQRYGGGGGAPSVPAAISDLAVTALGPDSVELDYTGASGATSHEYRIDGSASATAPGDGVIDGLQPETEYLFEVRGVNDTGPGPWSNAVAVTTDPAETVSLATPITVTHVGSGLNQASARYAPPVGSIIGSVFATSAAQARCAISRPGVLSKFAIRFPQGTSQGAWTCTLMKNGVDTALVAVINSAVTTAIDLSHTVDVVAGDDICFKIVPTGTPTAQTGPVQFAFTFTGTDVGESVMFAYYGSSSNLGYMGFAGVSVPVATEADVQNRVPPNCSGTMTRMSVHLHAAPGVGNSRTYTIRKNGVDTALTVTISGTNTDGQITGQNVTWSALDLISIGVSATGSPGSTACGIGVDWLPGINGNVPVYGRFGTLSATAERFAPLTGAATGGATVATDAGAVLPIDLSVYNFLAELSTAPGSGKSRNFKLAKNAVDTALSITIADAATQGTDTANVVAASQFDRLAFHTTPSGSPVSPTWVRLSAVLNAGEVEVTPPTNLAPTNITLSSTNFLDSATVGQTLATISVVDPDVGDTHTLTLGGTDAANYTIVGNELRSAATLTPGTQSITIEAEDAGGLTFLKTFGLFINESAGDYTIDDAEAEIEANFVGEWQGLAGVSSWDTSVTVTSATALHNALAAACSTASGSIAITRKHRIICDWNGVSSHTANIIAPGYGGRTDGHLDNGGGIYVVAAAGKSPALGNQVNSRVRGLHFHGVQLMNQWSGSFNTYGLSTAEAEYGLLLQSTPTFPAAPITMVEDALFGVENLSPGTDQEDYIGGLGTSGTSDYLRLKNCTFKGVQNAAKVRAKLARIDGCDFQLCVQDCIDLFGHTSTTDTDYFAVAIIERCTFRNAVDGIANRNNHMDMAQTGTSGDKHRGYRVLMRDCIGHLSHSYAGDPGQGGGSQGCYNDDHLTADNQFVIRRSIFLTSAPFGFAYWSPQGTKPSFIDRCTFTRCGQVPSNLPGDENAAQDFSPGLYGGTPGSPYAPPLATALYVTGTIEGINQTVSWMSRDSVKVDPRNTSIVAAGDRPEAIFKGTFTRGEHIAGKLSYTVANETGTRAQFAAGVWAKFEPNDTLQGLGYGCPDPTGLF